MNSNLAGSFSRRIRSGVAALILSLALCSRTNSAESSRPNILFFLVDDMGWQDTSVEFHTRRTPFNDFFHTPGMERLASTGVRFTQAYSCAVCTPTRVSWLIGQNAARHRVTSWTLQGETGGASAQLLPPDWKKQGFQPGEAPTVPMLLRNAGYRTIHVGKAHWGAVGTPGSNPLNLGFDVNIAGHAAGAPESYQGKDRYGEGVPGKEVWAVPGLPEYKGTTTHLTEALTFEACREIEKSVKELQQPFFLYLAHYAVHTPLQPHRPYDERYRGLPVADSEVKYASMVEGMDASLGQVLDKLKELGVAGNTLVVFYTDNGGVSHAIRGTNILGTAKDTHNQPLREGKGSAYEGGIRVPAIVSWAEPQATNPLQRQIPIQAGARCARPIIIEDLYPTFLNWAGTKAPADSPMDGEDLTPLLAHPDQTARASALVWHFPNVWTPYPANSRAGYRPHSVLREGDWKAIYFYEEERWELYNLAADLSEVNNLAAQEPARLSELATQLRGRLLELKSPWPVDRTTGQPRLMKLPGDTVQAGKPLAPGAAGFSPRPNLLLAIADDWGVHAGAYGTPWVRTPAFDRVAREGILFNHAYTPNAKCAPSRASLLTGRNSWQLKAAANHICYFPPEFKGWGEALAEHGWFVGHTQKGWGPGVATNADGRPRQMTGKAFNARKATPPTSGISNNDYAANFEDFLDAAPASQPWCFWYGAIEPHRAYEFGSGVAKGGKKLADIGRVPGYWPDTDTVRHDLLDYAYEVEHFDRHLGRMLAALEQRGLLENTLVIVTSDHGMPFPRVKGNAYDFANHVPLAAMWKRGIARPGRVVDDFVSFIDLAPTFLELAGLKWSESGLAASPGRSLVEVFRSEKSGQVDPARNQVLIGKERTDIGRPHDWGYPIRGLVQNGWLYLRNFEPSRWPAGNPETGYLDCDAGATKTFILEAHRRNPADRFWALGFGKRPAEELYDLQKDPDCLNNLASQSDLDATRTALREALFSELKQQGDPRMVGQGDVFDQYLHANPAHVGFYERFLRGEKLETGWVNVSDFETTTLP